MKQKCPMCDQYDSIKKVSAIVAGGTVVSQTQGYSGRSYETSEGISQSVLCQTLTFSPKGDIGLGVLGFFILLFGILLGIGFIAVVSSPASDQSSAGWLFFLGLALIIAGISMMAASGETSQDRQARAIWETLYYCNRDDVVYIPDSPSRCVPRTQMSSLLY